MADRRASTPDIQSQDSVFWCQPGNTACKLVGYVATTEEEMLELQDGFKGLNNPYEMIGRISNRMISDVLAFLKTDGCEARIQFHADD